MITSGREIRQRLGNARLGLIRNLDPYRRHRARTDSVKRRLIAKYGSACAHCGGGDQPEGAHIVPLEIGASTTGGNVIILCRPCHQRYDAGHVSIGAMRRLAENWRAGHPGPGRPIEELPRPAPSITPPPPSVQQVVKEALLLQREMKLRKAVRRISDALLDPDIPTDGRVYLQIKRAELTRRRSSRDAVLTAIKYLDGIDSNTVAPRYMPVYYYEVMYALRLAGHQSRAMEVARLGTTFILEHSPDGPGTDYLAARMNVILCELSLDSGLAKNHAGRLIKELRQLEELGNAVGDYWGGRWALNCAAHAVQVRLKAGDRAATLREMRRFRRMYYESNAANGWDIGSRQSVSLIEGLVRAIFPTSESDSLVAVGLLARSFLSRLGTRQRPEGIRDAGFGLAVALQELGGMRRDDLANHLEEVMTETVDGTSVVWPFNWDAKEEAV